MQKIFLYSIFLISLIGINISSYAESSLSSLEFKNLFDDKEFKGVILDIRTPEEWQNTGIIPGAITKNFRDPDFKAYLKNLDSNKQYYVYCHSGGRSAKASEIMKGLNLKVIDLHEGIIGWKKKNFPTKTVNP